MNFRRRSGAAGSQLNACLCLCCCRGTHCDEDDSDYRGPGLEMVLSDHCEAEIHHDHRRGCLHLDDLQQRDLCLGSHFDCRRLVGHLRGFGHLRLRASSHHSDCTPCGRRNSNYCISDNASRHRGRFLSSRCGLRLDRRGRFGIPHGRHVDRHDLFDRDRGHHGNLHHRHFDHPLLRASSHHNDCIRCGRRS